MNYLINFGNNEFETKTDINTGQQQIISVSTYIVGELMNEDLELKNLIYHKIFEDYKNHLFNNTPLDTNYFLNNEDDNIRNLAADITIAKDQLSNIWTKRGNSCETPETTYKKDIPKTILTFKLKIISNAEHLTIEQLKDSSMTPERFKEITDQIKKLTDIKKVLTQNLNRHYT